MKMRGKASAVYGSATDAAGNGAPALVERMPVGCTEKAGFAPERLDTVIEDLICNAESGARLLRQYTPMLGALMKRLQIELGTILEQFAKPEPEPGPDKAQPGIDKLGVVMDLANRVSLVLERVNKMTMNTVSAKDEATRLRTFLVTGDEETGGLSDLSEAQLRRIVARAASGWTTPEPEK